MDYLGSEESYDLKVTEPVIDSPVICKHFGYSFIYLLTHYQSFSK